MKNTEKIKKGLGCHQVDPMNRVNCADCPYYSDGHLGCWNELNKDAIALIEEMEKTVQELKEFINGFSKDAVVVVRCKDCKYYSGQFCNKNDVYPWPKDDWYCPDGVKRE